MSTHAVVKPITSIDIDNYFAKLETAKRALKNCSADHINHWEKVVRTYESVIRLVSKLRYTEGV